MCVMTKISHTTLSKEDSKTSRFLQILDLNFTEPNP